MARTPSNMAPLGSALPPFALPDTVTGRTVTAPPGPVVVAFLCNHCPFVIHIRDGFAAFARDVAARGVAVVAISSNSARTHPMDGPSHMKALAQQQGWDFPYCHDESQDVARAFDAACTPDLYVYDGEHRLAYRGQFDGARPGNGVPVTGADLRAAVDAVLAGRPVEGAQIPSIGCNIKWD